MQLLRAIVEYRADTRVEQGRWKSPIHMPKWASRLTYRIAGLSVERIQEITDEGAIEEGMADTRCVWEDVPGHRGGPKEAFRNEWEKIHGQNHPWDTNEWVFVIKMEEV